MANYPIPPWLQPADPVSAYAQGLQIGTRIGSEQTRQATEQAAIDRQTQMQAVEEARKQVEFGLKQQAAARRYAAQAKYQDLLSQGVDPAKALLQVAPDLGESLTGAAQLYKSSQPQQMTPYQEAEIEARNKDLEFRKSEAQRKSSEPDAKPKVFPIGPDVNFVYIPGGKTGHVVDNRGKEKEPKMSELTSLKNSTSDTNMLSQIDGLLQDQLDRASAALKGTKKKLTKDLAKDFLNKAGGDKAKARQMAKDAGYDF